jgi:hypothetical protein
VATAPAAAVIAVTASAHADPAGSGITGSGSRAASQPVNTTRTASTRPANRRNAAGYPPGGPYERVIATCSVGTDSTMGTIVDAVGCITPRSDTDLDPHEVLDTGSETLWLLAGDAWALDLRRAGAPSRRPEPLGRRGGCLPVVGLHRTARTTFSFTSR